MEDLLPKISYLLIDDDEDIVEVMNEIISCSIDSHSKLCYNGLEGYHQAQIEKYDFIITDYQLPSLNGIEFIRQIRQKMGPNQQTPIILLTGHQPNYEAKDSKDKIWEKVFFLEKPLTSKKLIFMIKCCIQASKNGGPGET